MNSPQIVYGTRINNPIKLSYCEKIQKNKPQSNAISSGILLMMISGMHLGWSTWGLILEIFFSEVIETDVIYILLSWYVGAIIGSVVGAVLVTRWKKNIICYLCSSILLVSGIILVITPDAFETVFTGRMIAGLGHGIVYVCTIIHAAEVATTDMRGSILVGVGYIISLGIFTASIFMAFNLNIAFILGIMSIAYAIMAAIFIVFFTYESPLFLIRSGNDTDALNVMIKLRSGSEHTPIIQQEFEEIKEMVQEESSQSANLFSNGNLRPLAQMLCTRIIIVLTNNALINMILCLYTIFLIGDPGIAIILLTAVRSLIAGIIPLFSIYFIGRKVHIFVSSMLVATAIFTFGIILSADIYWSFDFIFIPAIFCIAFQLFAGIGVDVIPHILTGEAFAGPKNAWSITVVCIAEYLLSIAFVFFGNLMFESITPESVYAVIFLTAAVIALMAAILHFTLPETRTVSLRISKNMFSKRYIAGHVYMNRNMQGITYS